MSTSSVDLTNCDREPIHVPGAIQSHGVLLAIEEPGFTIIQASANAAEALGLKTKTVLGSELKEILDGDTVAALQAALFSHKLVDRPQYLSPCGLRHTDDFWSAAFHRRDQVLLLELQREPLPTKVPSPIQQTLRKAIADLDTCETLDFFLQAATKHFQKLTQFDRVMVYRFLEDGSGVVVAESCAKGLDPYLGLHYPASDIPVQARELYRMNPFRLTADVDAPVIALVPTLNPNTGQSLDLSFCAMRATSPIHLEYLRNMGVSASLSFSVLHNEQLWGLVACHHRAPRVLSQEVRIAGEILARFLGLQVKIKGEAEHKQYAAQLQAVRAQLHEQLATSGDYRSALLDGNPNLLAGIMADGVALCTGSQTLLLGQTISADQVDGLCRWLDCQPWQPVWSTHNLAHHYPPAASFLEAGSGVLVLRVAESSPETVIWFRPEIRQTVNWAGNPTKPAETSSTDGEPRLHPRRSFALWREQVRGQSAPWQPLEQDYALALRESMAQALLKHRAHEVSRLNMELTRSNQELEHFAAMASHDLQEPLRTITMYCELIFRRNKAEFDADTTEMMGFVVSASKRMSLLIRSLLDYARSGHRTRGPEPVAAGKALESALSNLRVPFEERTAQLSVADLPTVRAHPDQLARVFQNLMGNALKYCPADRTPKLEIAAVRQGPDWLLSLHDNGAGFDPAQAEAIFQSFYRLQQNETSGTGLGLAICRKIVQDWGGKLWAETVPGEGSVFRFTIPAG